ncbi:MAG: glycoside hydrolase family 27 protein [Bacteroidales bacterium]|nr:glycoside hydrolase family 27 protein [Bacteroidales bacterium]
MKGITAFLLTLLLSSTMAFSQKAEGLAQTPPMGWNSWNTFACDINEQLVISVVDSIVSKGLRDVGYNYIVIDDGWMLHERDKKGNLVADPEKFPNGIKHLADYVHSKGMKFGIYNCAGSYTCGGYPGGRGHEYQDALLYASWGVDFLKYDWCSHGNLTSDAAYTTMRDALYATGRPILFSICEWGDTEPWLWAEEIGHTWRISGDIYPCFNCEDRHDDGLPTQWSAWGIMRILNMRDNSVLRQYSKPGAWNDFDMMEVGNGMTLSEDRSHFALWSLLSSPLMLGNDVRKTSKETLEIITNKEIIAVNQDELGIQGFRFESIDSLDIWVKPLVNDSWAICFLNTSEKPYNLNYNWNQKTIIDTIFNKKINFSTTTCQIRDLFAKKTIGTTKNPTKTTINSHDVFMVTLKPIKK